jgi:hypothetical protein
MRPAVKRWSATITGLISGLGARNVKRSEICQTGGHAGGW